MPEPTPTTQSGNGVRVTGPGGWGIVASGPQVIQFLALIAVGIAICWINYAGFAALQDNLHTLSVDLRLARSDHSEIQRGNRELTCILALEQDDRVAALRSGDACRYAMANARERPRR